MEKVARLILAIVLTHVSDMLCSVVPLTGWTTPCNRMYKVKTISASCEKESIEEIHDKIAVAKYWTKQLMNEYRIKRIEDPFVTDILMNTCHDGFPTSVTYNQSSETMEELLPSLHGDYGNLSILAVFLEKAKEDEIHYDDGEFLELYTYIDIMLYSSLCSLQNLLHCFNEKISSHVTRDVMSEYLRSLSHNTVDRYYRDFITVKDANAFFTKLQSKYESLLQFSL